MFETSKKPSLTECHVRIGATRHRHTHVEGRWQATHIPGHTGARACHLPLGCRHRLDPAVAAISDCSWSNAPRTKCPTSRIEATPTTANKPINKPYSIAVAPSSSCSNQLATETKRGIFDVLSDMMVRPHTSRYATRPAVANPLRQFACARETQPHVRRAVVLPWVWSYRMWRAEWMKNRATLPNRALEDRRYASNPWELRSGKFRYRWCARAIRLNAFSRPAQHKREPAVCARCKPRRERENQRLHSNWKEPGPPSPKSKIRSTKSQTNSNDRKQKSKTDVHCETPWWRVMQPFGIFGFRILDSFRISDFELGAFVTFRRRSFTI